MSLFGQYNTVQNLFIWSEMQNSIALAMNLTNGFSIFLVMRAIEEFLTWR